MMVTVLIKVSPVTKHMFSALIMVRSYNQYCSNLTILVRKLHINQQ